MPGAVVAMLGFANREGARTLGGRHEVSSIGLVEGRGFPRRIGRCRRGGHRDRAGLDRGVRHRTGRGGRQRGVGDRRGAGSRRGNRRAPVPSALPEPAAVRRGRVAAMSPPRVRKAAARLAVRQSTRRRNDVRKLVGRFALDFAALREDQLERAGIRETAAVGEEAGARRAPRAAEPPNPALLRLRALEAREALLRPAGMPVDVALPNWTPLGPLAVPNGQTYGGARVLISGRVTAIAPHPTNGDRFYIGTSRGGVWRTDDAGQTWIALGDDQPSLAIGALAIGRNDPQVLYAGTGEGNVQRYSTAFPLSSAPGMYLGVGVLRS